RSLRNPHRCHDRGLVHIQSCTTFYYWIHLISSCLRFAGACMSRICSACSKQQFRVPQAPTSHCERALRHHSLSDVERTVGARIATFSCFGVTAGHDHCERITRVRYSPLCTPQGGEYTWISIHSHLLVTRTSHGIGITTLFVLFVPLYAYSLLFSI